MTVLDLVLGVKILGTGLFVGLPLLLLPNGQIAQRLTIDGSALPYLRLYGVAVLALLVGYAFGFSGISGSHFPLGIVCMGIVSNGLGFFVMLATGIHRDNRSMAALIGLIAIALVACILRQDVAMAPLSRVSDSFTGGNSGSSHAQPTTYGGTYGQAVGQNIEGNTNH
ncbi:MAG: hypothetical protein AAGG11_13245 [Pseudomonadota bacterium]